MTGNWSRDLPARYRDAFTEAKRILSGSSTLLTRGVVDTEAEQIVTSFSPFGSRAEFVMKMNYPIPPDAAEKVIVAATKRAQGEILQHLLGTQQFLSHHYQVDASVLVPRPETEVLVLTTIEYLRSEGRAPNVGMEIGLGSGVISIELLAQFPDLKMIASEVSEPAAEVAKKNARLILGDGPKGSDRLHLRMSKGPLEVYEAFKPNDHVDFLISNPPYLQFQDPMDAEVRAREPALALFAPAGDPLYFYRRIAEGAHKRILTGGRLFLEMPAFRSKEIVDVYEKLGFATEVIKDLGGHDRVLMAVKRENR